MMKVSRSIWKEWGRVILIAFAAAMLAVCISPALASATYIPPDPTNLANTADRYWVNYTWTAGESGNGTDSFNISMDETWTNGTTATSMNVTVGPCGWANIAVWAWNASGTGTLSAGCVSDNVQAPAAATYIPLDPASLTNTTGDDWVNYTWSAVTSPENDNVTDSYNISMNETWTNGTTATSMNVTVGPCGWANIAVWAWNASGTGTLSAGCVSDNVQAPAAATYIPLDPASLTNTTGDDWVNYTWSAVTSPENDNVTDSYNISMNETWTNGTTATSMNVTVGPCGWANIAVWAWNASGTGTLSAGCVSDNVQAPAAATYIPLDPASLTNTTGDDWVNYTWSAVTSPENDNVTDSYNISMNETWTNGTTATSMNVTVGPCGWANIAVWAWNASGTGTLSAGCVSDNVQAPAAATYIPLDPASLTNTTGDDWVNYTWSAVTSPENDNVTDSYNISMNETWTNGTTATSMNVTVGPCGWANIAVWAWNASGTGTLSAGCVSDNVQAPAAATYIPLDPASLTNTTGDDWVNYTWSAVTSPENDNVTDSYNISMNETWTNGTTATSMNVTVGPCGWANIAVWAWNASGTGTLSAGCVSDNVQAPAAATYIPLDPASLTNTTGDDWVNYTWSAGESGNVTDSYNISMNETWTNGTTATSMNVTVGPCGWANIAVWAWNASGTGTLSAGCVSDNVQAPAAATYIPLDPASLTNTTGDDWVNYTWSAVTSPENDNVTDSYNISMNETWTNGTTATSMNVTVGPCGWANIAVWAWNASGTGTLSAGCVSDNVQAPAAATYIPLDPASLTNTTGDDWVNYTWSAVTSPENDNVTDSYNISMNETWTNGTTATSMNVTVGPCGWANIAVWAWNASGTGTLSAGCVSDNVQAPAAATYIPLDPASLTNTTGDDWVNYTWSAVTSPENDNVTDSYNISMNETWTNGTTATSMNVTVGPCGWANIAVWAWNASGTGTLSAGCVSDNVQAPAAATYIPLDPASLTNTTGDDWVNYTWSAVTSPENDNVTDSYNISMNETWTNGTTATSMNVTVGPCGWANIAVWAWNASGTGTLSAGCVSDNVQAPAAATYIPLDPASLTNTTGDDWVNYTWSAGESGNVTDSYNISMNETWTNGTTATSMNVTVGPCGWANIAVWAWNASGTGTLSAGCVSDNVQAPAAATYIPLDPASLTNTTGDDWVNYTWSAGESGNVTDSYNISMNETWTNGTTATSMNVTVGPCGWANIAVWAWNASGTGTLSAGCVSDNVQAPAAATYIPLDPASLTNTTGDDWVNYTWSAVTSPENDNVTDSYNISMNETWTNGTTATSMNVTVGPCGWANIAVWAWNASGTGTLSAGCVSDNVQAPAAATYIPLDPASLTNTTGDDWVNYTWSAVTSPENDNVTDSYNISMNETWTNGTTATSMNVTVGPCGWANIAVWAWNASGTGTLSAGCVSDNVQAPAAATYIPLDPASLTNTTGDYWVNYTWTAGESGNVTDSYNVSVNGVWHNGTKNTSINEIVGSGEWVNITVWAWNASGTGTLSAGCVSDNAQAPRAERPPASIFGLVGSSGGGGTYPPGWFETPTPTVTATKAQAASTNATATPPGERVTPAPTKKPAAAKATAPAPEGTTAETAKKGAPGFTAVFVIAGMLAVAYAMMRWR